MARTTRIVWDIPPEEHAFWRAQARACDLTVGELLYVLASVYVLEGFAFGELPRSAQCLRAVYQRMGARHAGRK